MKPSERQKNNQRFLNTALLCLKMCPGVSYKYINAHINRIFSEIGNQVKKKIVGRSSLFKGECLCCKFIAEIGYIDKMA